MGVEPIRDAYGLRGSLQEHVRTSLLEREPRTDRTLSSCAATACRIYAEPRPADGEYKARGPGTRPDSSRHRPRLSNHLQNDANKRAYNPVTLAVGRGRRDPGARGNAYDSQPPGNNGQEQGLHVSLGLSCLMLASSLSEAGRLRVQCRTSSGMSETRG